MNVCINTWMDMKKKILDGLRLVRRSISTMWKPKTKTKTKNGKQATVLRWFVFDKFIVPYNLIR